MSEILKPDMSSIWASGGAILTPSPAKVETGWTAEIPPHQWENYVQNRQDTAIAYLLQKGIPEWDATTEYQANKSFVQYSGVIYKAKTTNTNKQPNTNPSDWSDVISDSIPDASTTTKGIVELATNTETQTGTDANRAVTPAGLASVTATETRAGLVEIATTAEAQALTDDTTALTPKKLGDAMNAHVLGMGQTWQNVLGSRAAGVTYTNTTGRPITVYIATRNDTAAINSTLIVDSLEVSKNTFHYSSGSNTLQVGLSAVVPAGSEYSLTNTGGTIEYWTELR